MPNTPSSVTDYQITTNYSLDNTNGYITGIQPETSAADFLKGIKTSEGEAYVLNPDGTINAGIVATGNQILFVDKEGKEAKRYTVIIYGDTDGDGKITSLDLLYIKRHILQVNMLSGAYLQAADTNRQYDGVTSMDLLYLKRHILSVTTIQQ